MTPDRPYIVELLTPGAGAGADGGALQRFGRNYRRIVESGCGSSVPDNPLGNPRMQALEALGRVGLPVDPEGFVMNLNTFHGREELGGILRRAADAGVRYLLVVRGDGSPSLPRLAPADLGAKAPGTLPDTAAGGVVTSADLLAWIHREFPGRFVTGAAYNQYKPASVELSRLKRKLEAGAAFVVTQPVLADDPALEALSGLPVPVVVEAWMSGNLGLFRKSVKAELPPGIEGPPGGNPAGYDPVENLEAIHRRFPGRPVYLSMLDFGADWRRLLPRLRERRA
jgi:methylenetetrahydrofolate reductase (NADPH)